ncbi:Xenobiotic-transporting ATPase [Bertholletia excelsa]
MRKKFQIKLETMSSSYWLTYPDCSSFIIQPSDNASTAVQWLRFIFLSPCPQRVIFSAIDALFLLTLVVFAVHKLFSRSISKTNTSSSINKPLLEINNSRPQVTAWFTLSLVLTALLAMCYTVLCIIGFIQGTKSPWQLMEALFRLVQAITHAVILVLIAHEKKFGAITHPMSLRIYWAANFVTVVLLSVSGVARFVTTGGNFDPDMKLDDIVTFLVLPISAFLLVVAVRGSSGIVVREPLLNSNSMSQVNGPSYVSNVSGYATASFLSKLTWFWMGPLISKGYKSPLKMNEVPTLSPDHRAEVLAQRFEKIGLSQKRILRTQLELRCFIASGRTLLSPPPLHL